MAALVVQRLPNIPGRDTEIRLYPSYASLVDQSMREADELGDLVP